MANPVISWAKENPAMAAGAALGVIVIVMLATGGSDTAETDTAGSAGVGAYFQAVANQQQAGAAIQMTQIKEQAATNRALIAAEYGIERDKIWGPVSLATTKANAANDAASIKANREIAIHSINTQHAMYDNYINLQNAALTQQQNIAFKQANVANKANKRGFIGGIIGTVANVGLAVATGGTSLIGTGVAKAIGGAGGSGTGAVKLPSLGSSGEWV